MLALKCPTLSPFTHSVLFHINTKNGWVLQETTGWEPSDRGVSYRFGSDVVDAFLAKNNLSLIVRAHQVVEDGYEFFHERSLVTLFSAPNYCGQFDNAGALMMVKEDLTCSFSILPVSLHNSIPLPTCPGKLLIKLLDILNQTQSKLL